MTNTSFYPDKNGSSSLEEDPLMIEALDWVARVTSGRATRDDAERLRAWVGGNEAHRDAYAKATLLWRQLQPAAAEHLKGNERKIYSGTVTGNIPRRFILGGLAAAAASAIIASLIRPPLGLWPSFPELAADFRTGKGQRHDFQISGDGELALNTATSISQQRGLLTLINGEAIVVAKNAAVRLIAGSGEIMADQAKFAIRKDSSAVCLTCIAGVISLNHQKQLLDLKPNEQVRYTENRLSQPKRVDPEIVTAWQKNVLIFDHQTLAEVIEEVNRYRPAKIILLDRKLAKRTINATFRLDRLNDVITQITQVFGAKSHTLPGGTIILS